MLLTLILFHSIACEWVEISQQHYKKPIHTLHRPLREFQEKKDWAESVSVNQSLVNNDWDDMVFASTDARVFQSDIVHPARYESDTSVLRDKVSMSSVEIESQTNKDQRINMIKENASEDFTDIIPINRNKKGKPWIDIERPIEVFNLADLDIITDRDIFPSEAFGPKYGNIVHKQHLSGTSDITNGKFNPFTKSEAINLSQNTKRKISKPDDSVKLYSKTMRRVDIIRSTETTPLEDTKNSEQIERPHSATNKGLVSRVQLLKTSSSQTIKDGGQKRKSTSESTELITKYLNSVDKESINYSPHRTIYLPSDVTEKAMKSLSGKIPNQKVEKSEEITTQHSDTDNLTESGKYFEKTFINNKNIYSTKLYSTNKTPDPEHVMLNEILKKADSITENTSNKGTVKRVLVPLTNKVNKNKANLKEVTKANNSKRINGQKDKNEDEIHTLKNVTTENFKVVDQIAQEVPALTTPKIEIKNTKLASVSTSQDKHNIFRPIETLNPKPTFVTKQETFDGDIDVESYFIEPSSNTSATNDNKTKKKENETTPKAVPLTTNNSKVIIHKKESQKTNTFGNENDKDPEQPHTIDNIMKFLKIVTDTISRNTKRSFRSKVIYLEDLKRTIMANIEERIESLFPDDKDTPAPAESHRVSRSAHAHPRGHHVEFPSSEGALMTISFLTFAVYLIKLVLQVIHAYKNKTMMVPVVAAAVGRAAEVLRADPNADNNK